MTDKVADSSDAPSAAATGWLTRAAVLVPVVVAGVTNGILIVVSIVHRDSTVLVVAAIGVVVVGVLGVVADASQRATENLSKRFLGLERTTQRLQADSGEEQSATRESLGAVATAASGLTEKVDSLLRQSRVISREEFYEMAIRLVRAAPSRESTVRVFNLFGNPPSRPGGDAQSRWFALIATLDEGGPPINFRRIKLVSDARSMRWTLETLLRNVGRRNFSMAVIGGNERSLAYPLNAHSYFGTDAFILLPGRSPAVSDPDGPVIHITNVPEVEVLAGYHDNLFSSCDAKCEQGQMVIEDWRRFVKQHGFRTAETDQLLVALAEAIDAQ